MQTSGMEIGKLKALIKERMHHSYLKKFIQIPILKDEKLFIINAILKNTDLPENKKKNYIVSIMLVQMALDTHDLVPQTNDFDQAGIKKKSKQLSVLAGDYYSGLYYLILSEIEDVEMIQVLALSIKEINEYKMQLYYGEVVSAEAFLQIVKYIESRLITRVGEFMGESSITGIAAEWILIRKLNDNLKRKTFDGSSQLLDAWFKHFRLSDYSIYQNAAETLIQKEVKLVESSINQFPKYLEPIKAHLLETISNDSALNRSIAEEG